MKKTYVTTMPDHVGAFLEASRCIATLGLNITRVSYNKAVDTHTLFLEAEGTSEQLLQADRRLQEIGYLQGDDRMQNVVLLEFQLEDVPGGVIGILELIRAFDFNISYLSSQENGTPVQRFKMGLFVEDMQKIDLFIKRAGEICPVRLIDYNQAEKNFDNSIFYHSYATALTRNLPISAEDREELLIHVNLAMQVLDEQGLSPYRTFDSIGRFAEMLAAYGGEAFLPRISDYTVSAQTTVTVIEPPCGSNTMIVKSAGETLVIDTGYACYREEMLALLRKRIPDFDSAPRKALITHADVDHCGLLPLFDTVYMSHASADCIRLEASGADGFREQNPLHRPYIKICKLLTGYKPMTPDKIRVIGCEPAAVEASLRHAGYFAFGELRFELWQGQGGHLPGELVLIDYAHRLAFTGDVYVNLRGMTAEQAAYNQYAPILMTSVDTDPSLCAQERKEVFERLGAGDWRVFGSHGMMKEYAVRA